MACGSPINSGASTLTRQSSLPRASNDASSTVEGLRHGVIDYLTKPFERDRLCAAVSRGVEWHRAALDARRWREQLEFEMRTRRRHLQDVIASQFPDSSEDLDLLLASLTASTPEAYQHAHRVSALSTTIAQRLGLDAAEVDVVERAALLHDVGKLTMPDAVLRKPAPLTLEEQRLVRLYPQIGYRAAGRRPVHGRGRPVDSACPGAPGRPGLPGRKRGGIDCPEEPASSPWPTPSTS